jgi:hypothetical protein
MQNCITDFAASFKTQSYLKRQTVTMNHLWHLPSACLRMCNRSFVIEAMNVIMCSGELMPLINHACHLAKIALFVECRYIITKKNEMKTCFYFNGFSSLM